ncbi:hypothetical protein [Actinoplanes teichomyceticus]|uniref:Uncharacterized protein n=1 Tax=Actinoplanes teichomyceticus TaxID=1867 RepID=A0A561WNH6_ACTTI|nr:hypothetical protein [Actinoplanes teichomyceticus]TWG25420.1 hypothetical protein FHX34_101386 [Actinoplanes teichomyceticus]
MTERFLFGTPARHAHEPRSPIDGTAETLLFAGLARALATAEGTTDPRRPGDAQARARHQQAATGPADTREHRSIDSTPAWTENDRPGAAHEPPGAGGEPPRAEDGDEPPARGGAAGAGEGPAWGGPVPAWAGGASALAGYRRGAAGSATAPAESAAGLGTRSAGDGGAASGHDPAYREIDGAGHRGPEGRHRTWTDPDQGAVESAGGSRARRRGWRKRDRTAAPAEAATASTGWTASVGWTPNRERNRPAADRNIPAADDPRDGTAADPDAPTAGTPRQRAATAEPNVSTVDDLPHRAAAAGPAGSAAHDLRDGLCRPGADVPDGTDGSDVRLGPGPQRRAARRRARGPERPTTAADAAWKAFTEGDREPGAEIRTGRRARRRRTSPNAGSPPPSETSPTSETSASSETSPTSETSASSETPASIGVSANNGTSASAAAGAGAGTSGNTAAGTIAGAASIGEPGSALNPGPEPACESAAGAAPQRRLFLWPVALRCLLYLGPLSVAVAGIGALERVAWPVPAATLLLGWAAAQALTSVGVTVARRAGRAAAARLVGAGFAAVTALWCALVWIAPATVLGPDRLLAASVGAGGLATLATVTAALVTRSEAAVIRWYLPCWLLAGATLAAVGGTGWAGYVPVETLLPAALVLALVRAFRPVVLGGPGGRIPRLTAAERRRGLAYLIIGISQAICAALLWQAGPAVTPAPAALPLLLSVPLLEALIGWHTARIDAGLDCAESTAELDRHVRNVTVITLAGLLPPLAAGGALALVAYQLPYGLASLSGAREAALALAAGTLLGGVFAVTFLLAARRRTGIAATLAAGPPLATLTLPLFPQAAGPLPLAVAVLAATHVAGLLIVALTAADLRRTP